MPFSSKFIEETLDLEFHRNWATTYHSLLKTPSAFLSSFPRSGNGWVRLTLAAIFLQMNKVDVEKLRLTYKDLGSGLKYSCLTDGQHTYSIEEIFPDIYHTDMAAHYLRMSDEVKRLTIPVKLIKTHHIVDCQSAKTIFLFREPLPCLTSAALFLNRDEIENSPEQINHTVLYLARFYSAMLSHYLEQYERFPDHCFFLNHNTIFNRGAREIKRVLNFLNLQVELDQLELVLKQFPFKSTYDRNLETYITDAVRKQVQQQIEEKYAIAVSIAQSN